MPSQQDKQEKPCCCGLLRFHASTIAITSILFLLPLLLLALPGRENTGAGTTGFSTTQYFHGMPFVFLERQSVEYSGTWANKIFTLGAKPKDIDFDAVAAKHMGQRFFDGTFWNFWGIRQNTPTKKLGDFGVDEYEYLFDAFETSSIEDYGFWSDGNRWPWMGSADGEAIRIHWIGLLIDGLLLLLTSYLFARLVEYRLSKRGSHFSFSLAELLVGLCVAGVFFAWITTEYRRALKENNAVDQLIAAVEIAGGDVRGERRNGLPILASELLDHRSAFPLVGSHLFRPVQWADVSLYSSDENSERLEPFLTALKNVDFPIHLEMDVDEQDLPALKEISGLKTVERFHCEFLFDLEWDETIEAYRDNIDLSFKVEFPQLKELAVRLQTEVDQEKQLEMFTLMTNLEQIEVSDLNENGAKFLSTIIAKFKTLKRLEVGLDFDSFTNDGDGAPSKDAIAEIRFEVSQIEELEVSLDTAVDQRKQLEMFATMTHLKRLEIHDLNRDGAAYLNSIAKELPAETLVRFHDEDQEIELVAPIKITEGLF